MPKILIVDDETFQRRLLRETLSTTNSNLVFHEASNGADGVTLARQVEPDVILMDVMMPLLDGFEATRRIKAEPNLRDVPILLVTALGHLDNKVNGLRAGADDFVNKPFEEAELLARVRNALARKALSDELRAMNALRDSLVRMLMHDMGNLVSVINQALGLYQRLPQGSTEAERFLQDAYEANQEIAAMINDTLDVSRLETARMPIKYQKVDMVQLLQTIVAHFRGAALENRVQFQLEIDSNCPPVVQVDSTLINRVVANLITNALKYAPLDSTVTITYGLANEHTFRLTVSDQGPGIPPEQLGIIFDKYAQASRFRDWQDRPGRGIGLTFSKMAVEAHDGAISVESVINFGATFIVDIPLRTENVPAK